MKHIYEFIIILSIYKSCVRKKNFHEMVTEIVLSNKIQIIFFSNQFIYLKGKKYVGLDGWKVHVSHIFLWRLLQLNAMYCLLRLKVYVTCRKQLGTIASHMW
jgi:hypothetical protein